MKSMHSRAVQCLILVMAVWVTMTAGSKHRLEAQQADLTGSKLPSPPRVLPPDAPVLNPAEYLWSCLKTIPLANLPLPDLDSLTPTARRALFWTHIRHRISPFQSLESIH